MNKVDYLLIQTTTDDENIAQTLARHLIQNHLAACVQIMSPVTSYYRWEAQVTTSQEWLLQIKTTLASYPQVEQAIRQLHNYQIPEIIALPIIGGSNEYFKWIDIECQIQ